jgi:hypothetical protein
MMTMTTTLHRRRRLVVEGLSEVAEAETLAGYTPRCHLEPTRRLERCLVQQQTKSHRAPLTCGTSLRLGSRCVSVAPT